MCNWLRMRRSFMQEIDMSTDAQDQMDKWTEKKNGIETQKESERMKKKDANNHKIAYETRAQRYHQRLIPTYSIHFYSWTNELSPLLNNVWKIQMMMLLPLFVIIAIDFSACGTFVSSVHNEVRGSMHNISSGNRQ